MGLWENDLQQQVFTTEWVALEWLKEIMKESEMGN